MESWAIEFLNKYSLVALAIGTFFEGESFLVTAGVLVSRGKMDGFMVWLVAAISAWLGHMVLFAIGRYVGSHHLIRKFPRWEGAIRRADAVILKRPILSIVVLQYMYGMRFLGAMALGFSKLNWGWFGLVQAANCMLWSALIGGLGYALGESAEYLIGYSSKVFLIVVAAALLFFIAWKWIPKRKPTP